MLAWIEDALGTRYRARARYTSGALRSEQDAAEIMMYAQALGDDFLPSLVWLIAGAVAVHGAGDAEWLRDLERGALAGPDQALPGHDVPLLRLVSTPPKDWSSWRAPDRRRRLRRALARLAARGDNPHGEADLSRPTSRGSVLDGGCGTGRLAIELARRGIAVLGRRRRPGHDRGGPGEGPAAGVAATPTWPSWTGRNASTWWRWPATWCPTCRPTGGAAAVAACARHLAPGGRLIAGFLQQPGWPTPADYDAWCAAAGLVLEDRFATWERAPYQGGDYAVAVHRSPG